MIGHRSAFFFFAPIISCALWGTASAGITQEADSRGFKAFFPCPPLQLIGSVKFEDLEIQEEAFKGWIYALPVHGQDFFGVICNDLSADDKLKGKNDLEIIRACYSRLTDIEKLAVDKRSVGATQEDGYEFVINYSNGRRERIACCRVGDKFYRIVASCIDNEIANIDDPCPPDFVFNKDVDKFFDSFQLLPAKKDRQGKKVETAKTAKRGITQKSDLHRFQAHFPCPDKKVYGDVKLDSSNIQREGFKGWVCVLATFSGDFFGVFCNDLSAEGNLKGKNDLEIIRACYSEVPEIEKLVPDKRKVGVSQADGYELVINQRDGRRERIACCRIGDKFYRIFASCIDSQTVLLPDPNSADFVYHKEVDVFFDSFALLPAEGERQERKPKTATEDKEKELDEEAKPAAKSVRQERRTPKRGKSK